MVHQHFALFDGMSVGENVALGLGHEFDATQRDRIRAMSEKYGLPLNPDALVFTLSAGEKQRIEIVRALLGDPQLLILDEPTSVLTPQEADALFATLRLLRDEGRGLVFISHKLNEVRPSVTAPRSCAGARWSPPAFRLRNRPKKSPK